MPKLLFLGMGAGETKRYIAESLLQQGHQLVVLTERVPAWAQGRLLHGEPADLAGPSAAGRAAALGRQYAVDGVFTCDEACVELAAEVADRLGLPGLSPQSARWCRDKRAMRERLEQAGVPSARSVAAGTVEQARAAAERIGYPVVLKPRNLGGSIGVARADGPEELERIFSLAEGAAMSRVAPLSGILVEEYLDGPEFSTESVTADGVTTVCGITEKQVGFPPFFEETGHVARPVNRADPLDARLIEVTRAAHRALGVTTGVTHCELRVTADGPHVIELGGRLAGDRIPRITQLCSGIDLIGAAAAVAVGAAPDLRPSMARVAGIRMVYPRHAGVVVRLAARDLTGLLAEMGWYAEAGQRVALPPQGFLSRLAYLVAVGEAKQDVVLRLDEAEAGLDIEIAPDASAAALASGERGR